MTASRIASVFVEAATGDDTRSRSASVYVEASVAAITDVRTASVYIEIAVLDSARSNGWSVGDIRFG